MKKRLTIVISHPIQYHAPLYTYAARRDLFDLHVIFHNDRGVRPFYDKLANSQVSYDNDLLRGYSYEFLTRGDATTRRQRISHKLLVNLEERILASKPHAVYFHGYNFIPHVRAFLRLRKSGIKIFFRGENEDVIPRPMWRNVVRESFLRFFLPRFDAILYIGKENKEFFKRRGVPDSKLFFVPYSADNEYFGIDLPKEDREAIRRRICREYTIDENSVIFINTCKHRPEKRPMDLVLAYIKARKELDHGAKSTLLLVGDGPQNRELRQTVQASKVDSIIFTGFVNQSRMRELLLASDYCVNPGQEPWGCVFNEALPAGLGLISSDRVVGWRDMVLIGENGFVYRFGDIEMLAVILTSCARNPQWRARFAETSKRIARLYSYETCTRGLKEALDALT